jgi:hypothetical protein
MAVESGWLIEKKDEETGNTVYTGVVDITTGIEKGSYIEWVPDAHNALRFARREDAQRHKDVFSGDDAIVAEHLFETPASAGDGQAQPQFGLSPRNQYHDYTVAKATPPAPDKLCPGCGGTRHPKTSVNYECDNTFHDAPAPDLREALKPFLMHYWYCSSLHESIPCDCGLEAALAGKRNENG